MRPEILALIPARGGSKGIPRKNLLAINGKPLIVYSIEQALASRHITRTIVSTDDQEIASVAKASGADVPFMRPGEIAQDDSTDFEVFHHALAALRDREGYRCECVVHLRPTGPVRRVAVIDEAIRALLADATADSLRSVNWPSQSPYKMWRASNGYLDPLLEVERIAEAHSSPRQSLPEVFWQNGYVDIVRPRVILEMELMAGRRVLPFVVREPLYELDYPEQIPAIEAALRRLDLAVTDDRLEHQPRHPV